MNLATSIPKPEKVFYGSGDGIRLCALWQSAIEPAKGVIVLAHGITVTKDEEGVFALLADALARHGFHSLRFDFRGHGESGGAQEDMTLAGEQQDLVASVEYACHRSPLPLGITAASFGAVSACCYAAVSNTVKSLVLWNPVLDLRKTFLEPELPWAQQSFNPQGFAFLKQHSYLLLDGSFKLGQGLIDEMGQLRPYGCLSALQIPVLTLHGDKDTYVSYEVSQLYGTPNRRSRFVTVPDSEHGFGRDQDREVVIAKTLEWFLSNLPSLKLGTFDDF